MAKIDNGGPAFPSTMSAHIGMSLRDYFAGQAITGWLASRESDMWLAKCGGEAGEASAAVAIAAFMLADAMIAERKIPR